jgi:hypothetical protein
MFDNKMKGIFFFFAVLLLISCNNQSPSFESVSFYYWRTVYSFNQYEKEYIEHSKIDRIFVRFFDVEWNSELNLAAPKAKITFSDSLFLDKVVPVVYIKNNVFTNLSSSQIDSLAIRTSNLVKGILNTNHIQGHNEVQFDCDWTETTKEEFFLFLEKVKALNPEKDIVSTVRLHQIKFRQRMGVPPGDRAVLMYYNMGKIACDSSNSILDNSIGEQYLEELDDYPLELSWALPAFSWGIHCVNNLPNHLLNKSSFEDYERSDMFSKTSENVFTVKKNGYFQGQYLYEGDFVKVEKPTIADLNLALKMLNKYSDKQPSSIVFFDLDSINISQYETFISQCSKD